MATVGGAGSGWQSSAVVVDVVVMNTGVGRWQRDAATEASSECDLFPPARGEDGG